MKGKHIITILVGMGLLLSSFPGTAASPAQAGGDLTLSNPPLPENNAIAAASPARSIIPKNKVLFSGYDFHPNNPLNNAFEVKSFEYVSPILELIPGSDQSLGNFRFTAIAAGDLNGDAFDEQIIAWVDPANNHIYIRIVAIPGTSGQTFDTGAVTMTLPDVLEIENRVMDVSTGQFSVGGPQQIILAYVDAGHNLRLELYQLQNNTSLLKIGEIASSADPIPGDMPRVAAGDVTGDGLDEIGLAHNTSYPGIIHLRVFQVVELPSGTTPYALYQITDKSVSFLWGNYYYFAGTLRIAAGDVVADDSPNEEFVLISDWYYTGDCLGVLVQVYDNDPDGWAWSNHLAGMADASGSQNWGDLYATGFDVAVGNVDGTGLEEVIFTWPAAMDNWPDLSRSILVYRLNNNAFEFQKGYPVPLLSRVTFLDRLAVGDLDQDLKDEILLASSRGTDFNWQNQYLDVFDFETLNFGPVAQVPFSFVAAPRAFNLAIGNFAGESVVPPTDSLQPRYLAIVDVYVTNRSSNEITPPYYDYNYTGVTSRTWFSGASQICTVPYKLGDTGSKVFPSDINQDIGGDNVYIWVKYDWVAPTDATPVLVGIQASHWPDWNVNCPAGWEAAHGDIGGALTTKSDNDCNRVGLCVRYAPMNETDTFITNLSLYNGSNYSPANLSVCPANRGYWPMTPDLYDIHTGCGGNFMFLAYNQARKWPVMPTALPTPSDSQIASMLKTYAPRVWLAGPVPDYAYGEEFFPSSVEWAFPYLRRNWWNTWTWEGENEAFAWWLATFESLDETDSVLDYFHGCNSLSTNSPCSLQDAPVYAFSDEVEFNVSYVPIKVHDLEYFLYFPYNRGKTMAYTVWGNHVSDWEYVSVRLTQHWDENTGWSLKPAQVYLSAHENGSFYSWSQINRVPGSQVFLPFLSKSSSGPGSHSQVPASTAVASLANPSATHPVVFAAAGSHGIWGFPGWHAYQYIGFPFYMSLIDNTSFGYAWDTWRLVKSFDYETRRGLDGNTWPSWMSKDYNNSTLTGSNPASGPIYRWGNSHEGCYDKIEQCALENGPTGPVDKSVWDLEIMK